MRRLFLVAAALGTGLAVSACGDDTPASTAQAEPDVTDTAASPTTAQSATAPQTRRPPRRGVNGTVVRFQRANVKVDVTMRSDHPASRDFLSMLPMTVNLEEFSGREKIAYLSRKLRTGNSPGSDPENGDLIYYAPWGNIGFYYNTTGVGYSDDTINLGTYRAPRTQLARLQGKKVSVRETTS